jgi:CheY-like chemotaxis protein
MSRILVVDDDPDFVEIVRLVLQREGYEVVTAPDGDTALRIMQESPPDLILLDVMMKGVLDGVETARAIGDDEIMHQTPLIMVSSITSSPMAEFFPTDEYLPIDTWISKPIQPEDLLKTVERYLK